MDYENPIDSTEDLVKSDNQIILNAGTWHAEYFRKSTNSWRIAALEKAKFQQYYVELDMEIAKDGKRCVPIAKYDFFDKAKTNPKYKNIPPVHFSKETIKPYFTAWAIQKNSIWKEAINIHILKCHQVKCQCKARNINICTFSTIIC